MYFNVFLGYFGHYLAKYIDKVYIDTDRPCDLLIRRSIDKFLSDVLYAR